MWTKKRRAKGRPRSELWQRQHLDSEEEPAETVGVPREGAEEPWVVWRPGRVFTEGPGLLGSLWSQSE